MSGLLNGELDVDGERISFIPERELDDAFAEAERFLSVRTDAFPDSVEGRAILDTLRATYDPDLPPGRRVGRMPLACATTADGGRYWSGTDVVLGCLAEPGIENFELRSGTICRRLVVDGNRIRAAEVEQLSTGRRERIVARTFFVAADALRTPQLLWASGIRPPALGRYLTRRLEFQQVSTVRFAFGLIASAAALPIEKWKRQTVSTEKRGRASLRGKRLTRIGLNTELGG